ncbi:UPF0481 protein At3g47200-like [Diospyros lotus]|uniref:UPF0481 protein At3g47200-like n=1 Tax=Diospyros lotus TaxID=55363 RepID=UPI002255316C|nr:UPF0481 protein At3g47200-like [Diospyros lotus]
MSMTFNTIRIRQLQPNIDEALQKDILSFLNYDISKYSEMGKSLHVLDLHRKALLHTHNKPRNVAPSLDQREGKNKGDSHKVFRPATKLHEAGVRFMTSESISLRDITFYRDGDVLKLPNFIVDDYTELMYLNLIAFERCHVPASSNITSFVAFMDCIIDDHRDIKLLSSKGIINNFIRTDNEAADLFNRVSRDLAVECLVEMNFHFYKVYKNLIDYSNMRWNKWQTCWNKWHANLTQTYFRSP